MSLILDRPLTAAGTPERPGQEEDARLDIVVIFTSASATIAALKKAGSLAESLGLKITLVVPQIVPFPLPLTSPPVLLDFQEKRFRELAMESPVDVRVQIFLCRDALETLKRVLTPRSVVIVGGRRRWWPTKETRLARQLRRDHDVIFTETE